MRKGELEGDNLEWDEVESQAFTNLRAEIIYVVSSLIGFEEQKSRS